MEDSPSNRKPDRLRRRYLAPRHRGVPRPYNPSVGPRPGPAPRVPGRRARRVGRGFLRGLPWLGLACWLALPLAGPLGVETARPLLVGLGAGALAMPLIRTWALFGARRAPKSFDAAARGIAAMTGLGLGAAPGLCILGGALGWCLGSVATLLGLGGLGLGIGWRASAWTWRLAGAVALLMTTVLLFGAGTALLDGRLVLSLGRALGAGALGLVAWLPAALLAVALEDDPSAESLSR